MFDFDEGLFVGLLTLTFYLLGYLCILSVWAGIGIGMYYFMIHFWR